MNRSSTSRASLRRINAFQIARQAGCAEGWRLYQYPSEAMFPRWRFYAPGTLRSWVALGWGVIGNLGIVALLVIAIWAFLAGGASR